MKSQAYVPGDTIAAIATPQGPGAIGVIRLSGDRAVSLAASLVTLANSRPLASLEPRRAALAVFHQNGTNLDRVLVTVFRAPHSFTGEDVVEISCHGGPAVMRRALELILAAGARAAEPGEFSQRAYLNGKMDLIQAEALAELIRARTDLAVTAAFTRMEGGLSDRVRELRSSLIGVLALAEAALDHSDDAAVEEALARESAAGEKVLLALADVRALLATSSAGLLLRDGARVTLAGRPNAGKSSLLNLLLGTQRAIVTPEPGTTRDTLEEGLDLDGVPAILVDTAGIRSGSSDPVEKLGIERARRSIEGSDAAIAVVDASRLLSDEDRTVAGLLRGKPAGVVALNKSDLPSRVAPGGVRSLFPDYPVARVSALRGDGSADLAKALREVLLARAGVGGEGTVQGAVLVSSVRQKDCLERTAAALERALAVADGKEMEECFAMEMREALDALGEMAGETAPEDVLKRIFSSFCVGK